MKEFTHKISYNFEAFDDAAARLLIKNSVESDTNSLSKKLIWVPKTCKEVLSTWKTEILNRDMFEVGDMIKHIKTGKIYEVISISRDYSSGNLLVTYSDKNECITRPYFDFNDDPYEILGRKSSENILKR